METVVSKFKLNNESYIIETPLRRQEVGNLLFNYFRGAIGTRLCSIDLDAASYGNRQISRIDNYVIKQSDKAQQEFKRTLKAETITDITPIAGGLLRGEYTTGGLVALEFFDGIPPINLNASKLNDAHREKILKGILFAMGKLHLGNMKEIILHRDGHLGNFIVIPNPNDKEHLLKTNDMLEIRVIDLEKALIVKFNKKMLNEMAYDLIITFNQLIYSGFIKAEEVWNKIDYYLEANSRLERNEFIQVMREEIPKHKKFKKINEALEF
ncbi:MAG: hypothetical protein QXS93_03775 [Candidatus Micrarchaeia archaeon]